MRWILTIFLLSPLAAWPQWLHFDACGMDATPAGEMFTGKATHIGPYWIWKPAIVAVREFQEPPRSTYDCSIIFVGANQFLIVGDMSHIMAKLRRATAIYPNTVGEK